MTAPSTSAGTMVREATPADLADVVKLLSARDDRPRDPQVVSDYLWGLDRESTRAWLAYAGDEPVGITMLYLRQMNWPASGSDPSPIVSSPIVAGYWSHLYVSPAFRKKMVYPQLVLKMLRGMKSAGIEVIFTATRQPQVAQGHQRLGFALVDKIALRLRPLRPFRLMAKHKGAAALAPLCAPLDALYGLAARRRTNPAIQIENVPLDSPLVDEVVTLLNSRPTAAVRQVWTAEQFRRRYHTTLDGTSYRIRAVLRGKRLAAVLVMTIAERGNRIRAGVLLELAVGPDAATEIDALLADAENFAHHDGAEVMLSLEGSLSLEQLAGSFGKYLVNRSEAYHLLVYPKPMAQAPHLAAELVHWTFAFADHDAF